MAEKSVGEIVDMASAFYQSAVLFAAISCGVFEAVEKAGGDATAARVSKDISSDVRATRLLLDACVAIGIMSKSGEVYANTAAGRLALVPGGPADLSKAIMYNKSVYPAWGRLEDFVRTGRPAERPEIHLGEDAARTRIFALSMRSRALAIGRGVVPMLRLEGAGRLLDLAGGPGTYAELIAGAFPTLCITTVDLPAISAVAKECVAAAGLENRIECRPGNYHSDEYEASAYDAVTIFGALHQESPDDISAILARAYRALKPGGKLYVLDMMTDSTHTAPQFSALFGVNMALTTENGWVFSDVELKGWMEKAGFEPGATRTLAPPMPHWLVEAVKPLA